MKFVGKNIFNEKKSNYFIFCEFVLYKPTYLMEKNRVPKIFKSVERQVE